VVVTTHGTSLEREQENLFIQGGFMQNKKDNESSMSPTPNKDSGMGDRSGKKSAESNAGMEDDDMQTSGGRQGNFSDKNREKEGQWSPGSSGASDQ
jgi:hypothetical protein